MPNTPSHAVCGGQNTGEDLQPKRTWQAHQDTEFTQTRTLLPTHTPIESIAIRRPSICCTSSRSPSHAVRNTREDLSTKRTWQVEQDTEFTQTKPNYIPINQSSSIALRCPSICCTSSSPPSHVVPKKQKMGEPCGRAEVDKVRSSRETSLPKPS